MACCEKFAESAGKLQALAGGVGLYPQSICPPAQFEFNEQDNTWGINGCCGGGCYVVTGMVFCPFCGAKLEV